LKPHQVLFYYFLTNEKKQAQVLEAMKSLKPQKQLDDRNLQLQKSP
jgi:hypothetical protein